MTDDPILVLITGLPGTGKSTIAAAVAAKFGTAVLAHDWAMSGLRSFPAVQDALDSIEYGHRLAGWSILIALARAQLVESRSIVLDGVARVAQRDQCEALAQEVGAAFVVISAYCSDPVVHRSRIEGRERRIPNWYELEWSDVERARADWSHLEGDLELDAVEPWAQNEHRLDDFLAAWPRSVHDRTDRGA